MAKVRSVPVFPLEGVFLCPGLLLPLHIFEQRYRDMLQHALAGDRRIMLAHPQVGHSTGDEVDPPLHPACGMGEIVEHQILEDGRANILLRGETRMQILDELPKDHSFRVVQALPVEEQVPDGLDLSSGVAELLYGMRRAGVGSIRLPEEVAVQQIVDVALIGLPLATSLKLAIFGESRVDLRLQKLLEQLPTGGQPDIEIGPGDPRLN